ncbi:hypothetical protein E2562_035347, partial [Oryza meyeriana var. granulata]
QPLTTKANRYCCCHPGQSNGANVAGGRASSSGGRASAGGGWPSEHGTTY